MDFTSMKLGKFSLNFTKPHLGKLVKDLAEMVKIQISLRPSVQFILDIDESTDTEFLIDE